MEPKLCEVCNQQLTEENLTYESEICDECYEANEINDDDTDC